MTSDDWLAYLQPDSHARLRLFCFPYAGGGGSAFRSWSDSLPPGIELCPVQIPGRENRLHERPFTNLMSLVQALAAALRPYFDKPFAFFGHSMGGLISFELTRHLAEQNVYPTHLFVSGRRAAHLPSREKQIHQLPKSEFIQEISQFNGTPQSVLQHEELFELFLPTLRADFTVCETYAFVNDTPVSCPVSAFGGLQDPDVTYEELDAWKTLTTNSFRLRMLPGDHFFLHNSSHLLLQALSRDLMQSIRALEQASR